MSKQPESSGVDNGFRVHEAGTVLENVAAACWGTYGALGEDGNDDEDDEERT
ncbi:hypothetical protein SAMD00023353_1202200 [Rosellinia necatrix]|uniref:Uncharacterized protein n=1 Tax=Rosellinia necatrix TaxID=77044 RepID=A0A1W2TKJ1_ROSNE|nr:hypothetical protein SAMD00023353_1202200 [Rosellinia necatrix]